MYDRSSTFLLHEEFRFLIDEAGFAVLHASQHEAEVANFSKGKRRATFAIFYLWLGRPSGSKNICRASSACFRQRGTARSGTHMISLKPDGRRGNLARCQQ